MQHRAVLMIILGTCLLGGCTSAQLSDQSLPSSNCRRWVNASGGLVDSDTTPQALEHVTTRLLGVQWRKRVRICILDCDSVGAYAWPKRHIFVTRGMLEQLPEDQLAAAIAHELGHLIDDGHVAPPFALTGTDVKLDAHHRDMEHRADAIGCQLLQSAGYDAAAMTRLLDRMAHDPTLSPTTRKHLTARLRSVSHQAH